MTVHKPLIVQGSDSVLLEVASPLYEEARSRLLRFAELIKAPEHVHTYRITALSVWNARSGGVELEEMVDTLEHFSRYPVPAAALHELKTHASRFGRLRLVREDDGLHLESTDDEALELVGQHPEVEKLLGERSGRRIKVADDKRGLIKLALVHAGFPPADQAGYEAGERLDIALRETTLTGRKFVLRDYQRDAATAFEDTRHTAGGSGVIVLPCGAGKTVVGLACMATLGVRTLVLCTSTSAARQWLDEALDKTTLTEDQIGLYQGADREIRPVTVATYQMLTHRQTRDTPMRNLELFDRADWGLIVYDEVHLLPAPVFQITATLQARRRLGLTATLVREDGLEDNVFALIGPQKVNVPWRELEHQGWVAKARCVELRLPMSYQRSLDYARALKRHRFRVAAENELKTPLVERLLEQHEDEQILVMGMYVDQVKRLAKKLDLPFLTGSSPQAKRDEFFDAFRRGDLRRLVVSKIGNLAIDLPEASVAIQISGTFGSRQEEAQRLGRLLRPKADGRQATFYSLVSQLTAEEEFAHHRQRFLVEQGYRYELLSVDFEPEPVDS